LLKNPDGPQLLDSTKNRFHSYWERAV
jgi:hypothetical protein